MNQTPPNTTPLELLSLAEQRGQLSAAAAVNIRRWLTEPHYANYLPLVIEHIEQARWPQLEAAFWYVIPFGTAGRRGAMYPIGTGAINDRTIGESAQGLADYVNQFLTTNRQPLTTSPRCAIAYDTRHRSRQFAELCAGIMAANGFEVLFFDGHRATPELSFTVRDCGCACGIMITASHNPPSDNAIKVFWHTGGQLKPPHDAGVIAHVERVTQIKSLPFAQVVAEGRIQFVQDEQGPRYRAAVLLQSRPGPRDLKILYSPLHGVGLTSVLPVLREAGFTNVEVYQPHATPDGNFPNVPGNVANPENPAVFEALIAHARTSGAELILASDPDADRIGCAALQKNGEWGMGNAESDKANQPSQQIPHSAFPIPHSDWHFLTGNQIGVLLGEFLLRRLVVEKKLTPHYYIVKTLVTGDMICRVAEYHGVRTIGDVLTGFKWIGGVIDEVGPENFVLGFEEAHGYLVGTYTRDKDGAVAALLLAELAAQCKSAGITLVEHLDQLYQEYGCHQEKTISVTLPGADGLARMRQIMAELRTAPPKQLAGLPVIQLHDYATAPPPLTSDLLSFQLLPAGNRVAVRPSGTEPKIKFYLFAAETPENSQNLPATKAALQARLAALETELLAAAGISAIH